MRQLRELRPKVETHLIFMDMKASEMPALEFVNFYNIGVCPEAIEALEAFDGPIEEYFDTHPRGAKALIRCLKYHKEVISPFVTKSQIQRSVDLFPHEARCFKHFLTEAQVQQIVDLAPETAAKSLKDLLTDAQIQQIVDKHPLYAAIHLADVLILEQRQKIGAYGFAGIMWESLTPLRRAE